MKGYRTTLALVVSVLAAGALAAGCGGDGSDGDSGAARSNGTSESATESLTVAVATARPVFGQPYIAETTGCFKDENLNVKILDTTGSNTVNLVVSGQADLGMLGAGAPLIVAGQGRDTKIIYAHAGGGAGGILVGGKGIQTIDDLKGKRIGVLGVGSSTYGFAVKYNKELGLDADLVQQQDAAAITAGLASGRIAAATGSLVDYAPLVEKGDAKVLIDPTRQADSEKYVGEDYPEGATWGLSENLAKKKTAIEKLLKCFEKALQFVNSSDDKTVAAELLKSKIFQPIAEDDLAAFVAIDRHFLAPNNGRIEESGWDYALSQYAQWGIENFDPKAEQNQYSARVDMSYLNTALGG